MVTQETEPPAIWTLQWGHRYEAVDMHYWEDDRHSIVMLQWGHRYEAVDILLERGQ